MYLTNIGRIYDFMENIVWKQRGVFLSPEQATEYLDFGQLDTLDDFYKLYGQTQTIHDALRPFRVYYQFTSDSSGHVTFPSNYLHMLGSAWTVTGSTANEITPKNEDEWLNTINSSLRAPSNTYPVSRETIYGFMIVPQQTQIGFFTYLRRPTIPVYGYTQNGDAITYNPATSVQLDWNDNYINLIISKALIYCSVFMNEQEVLAFASQYQQELKPKE